MAAADELEPLSIITSEHRLRSFCVVAVTSSTVSLVLSTRTNELELRDASITSQMTRKGSVADAADNAEAAVRTLQLPGHRSAVRAASPDSICRNAAKRTSAAPPGSTANEGQGISPRH